MQSGIYSKVMFAILQEILSKTSVDFNDVISHLVLHILVLIFFKIFYTSLLIYNFLFAQKHFCSKYKQLFQNAL